MRRTIIGLVVAGAICAGCGAPRRLYRTEATVAPAPTAHHYTVEFRIAELGRDGKAVVLSAPRLTVKAGQDGQIKVCDAREWNGIFCSARVDESDAAVQATTTVVVRSRGKATVNNAQTITVKR